MNAKNSLWQTAWDIDQIQGLAIHDSGLRVRLVDGLGIAESADDLVLALTAQHGAHNASSMVSRLVREGEQLLIDPNSRGWRGKDRKERA